MEVHHHSHTARKKWTHYFWEFLMLFLAVFCGFLAEYQLEHKIEHDREKVFMKSMLDDLRKDTANINASVAGNRLLLEGLDTLLDLLSSPQQDINYQRRIYIYSAKYTYWYMPMQFSELTLSQLKFSGAFRLIKKHAVAAGILQYEQGIEAVKYNYDLLLNYYHAFEPTNKELFNMSLARKSFKAIEHDFKTVFLPYSEFEKLFDNGNYLDTKDPKLLSKYHDDVLYYQTTLSNTANFVNDQKRLADSLIRLIRTNYHIKE
jgi:hypothetical protein